MAGERGNGNATGSTRAANAPGSDRSPALALNWDDRIAEAREKRARILAERAASDAKRSATGEKANTPEPTITLGREESAAPGKKPAPKMPPRKKATSDAATGKTSGKTAVAKSSAGTVASDETHGPDAPADAWAHTSVTSGSIAPEILAAEVPEELAEKAKTAQRVRAPVPVSEAAAETAAETPEDADIPVFRHPADDPLPAGTARRVRGTLPPLAAQVPPADPKSRLRAFATWLDSTTPGVRMATVAFACCFGLGFGMVLSFGVLSAFGWIDPAQNTAALNRPALSDEPPEVLTRTAVSMLAPTPSPGLVGLTTPDIAQQSTARSDAPMLADNAPPDSYPGGFLSPGPLLGTYTPLLSGPAPISERQGRLDLTADKLAYFADTPSLPGAVTVLTDRLPELADRSKIALWTELATLRVPSGQPQTYAVPDAVIARTVLMPSPRMPGAQPGTAPELNAAAARTLPAVATAGIPARLPDTPPAADSARTPAGISSAPVLPPRITNVLYTPDNPEDLPQTGAPVQRKVTLAGRLGIDASERARFSLVTFAPGSVADDSIEGTRSRLSETGFPLGAFNRVSFRVSRLHVRYYHPDDAAVARAIAEEFGGPARDFTNISGTAPIGRVELWMPGTAVTTTEPVQRPRNNTAVTRAAPAPSAAELRAAAKERLRNRLINSLRKEEYK